jgi:hypothetical protein
MNKNDYALLWEQSARDGTLVTDKHDPDDLGTPRSKPRSVIAAGLAPVLPGFFHSGLFTLTHYENRRYPGTPHYFEITPTTPEFSVPASGVPPFATTPTSECDRLIIVSGESQGWHIYGESSAKIQQRLATGDLTNRISIV